MENKVEAWFMIMSQASAGQHHPAIDLRVTEVYQDKKKNFLTLNIILTKRWYTELRSKSCGRYYTDWVISAGFSAAPVFHRGLKQLFWYPLHPFCDILWQLLYFKSYEHIETYILFPSLDNQIFIVLNVKKSDKVIIITYTKTDERFQRNS